MAKHLVAFEAASAAAAYAAIAPLKDNTVTQDLTGKTITVPRLNKIVATFGYGVHLLNYQIQSPSLKSNSVLPEFYNIDPTATHPIDVLANGNGPLQLFDDNPIMLQQGEQFEADVLTDTTSGVCVVLVWLSDEQPQLVNGRLIPGVTASSATTLTANTWTSCILSFDYALPAGGYAVVGMHARSATGYAARLVFPGVSWRMGVIPCVDTLGTRPEQFRNGRFGNKQKGIYDTWGAFDSTSPPQVEFLGLAGDTAEYVSLDLVKIS
jgi:hypothetical protein